MAKDAESAATEFIEYKGTDWEYQSRAAARLGFLAGVQWRGKQLDPNMKFVLSALEWEEKRCGRLYGPLGDALKVLREASIK